MNERMNRMERKMDGGYDDLHAKVNDIYSHMKTLDNQIAQVASSSQRPAGKLPGKLEDNPKEYCKAITLRSGKQDIHKSYLSFGGGLKSFGQVVRKL